MPSGEIHRDATLRYTPLAVVLFAFVIPVVNHFFGIDTLTFTLTVLLAFIGYGVGYLWVSAFIDPDADQITLTSSEGRLMRKFGVLGFIVAWWMMPYGYFMTHRGVSHWHVIGTITRVLWLLWVPVTWYLLSGYTFPHMPFVYLFLGSVFTGLTLADSVHIWMDKYYHE